MEQRFSNRRYLGNNDYEGSGWDWLDLVIRATSGASYVYIDLEGDRFEGEHPLSVHAGVRVFVRVIVLRGQVISKLIT